MKHQISYVLHIKINNYFYGALFFPAITVGAMFLSDVLRFHLDSAAVTCLKIWYWFKLHDSDISSLNRNSFLLILFIVQFIVCLLCFDVITVLVVIIRWKNEILWFRLDFLSKMMMFLGHCIDKDCVSNNRSNYTEKLIL